MDNVIQFPHTNAPIQPVGQYIRLGETGHNKLGHLLAAGRFPATRVVVDASRLRHQKELVAALRARGAEIVLDTKVAELSALEKFGGYARHTPWATVGDGKPLNAGHFDRSSSVDIFGQIARFAVEHLVDAVLAPTHYVSDPNFAGWFDIDRSSCLALRHALDFEGGSKIEIDYLLIAPHTALIDDTSRSNFLNGLVDLPFENLWIRASGFGNDSGPLTTRRFINSISGLHNIGKPIVADYLGGMVGESLLAFGAVSAIAHGIGERERFDARSWHKPPAEKDEGGGGRTVRVLVPGIDRSVTRGELELMVKARGGHKLVACGNRACCPNGLKDMIEDPRQHAAFQSFARINEIASVPDLNRVPHFLKGRLAEADRSARQIKDLKFSLEEAKERKIDASKLSKRLEDHSRKLAKMLGSFEDLHESRLDAAPRARPIAARGKSELLQRQEKK